MKRSRINWAVVGMLSCSVFTMNLQAADWLLGTGNWSTVSPTTPGWSTATAPGLVGGDNFAQKSDGTAATTTVDVSGVTLGRLSMAGSSNVAWTVVPSNSITLDSGDANPAVISNINTAGTATGTALIINNSTTGGLILNDDLLISNTSTSTRGGGSIAISSLISSAGAGPNNVTIFNVNNTLPTSNTAFPGAIRLATADNTFVGDVLIQQGTVTFNRPNSFGVSNAITLGVTGMGGVTLLSTTTAPALPAAQAVAGNITVAAGTSAPVILGSNSTATTGTIIGYSGSILLNGNLTTTGGSYNNGVPFAGNIMGVGGITHFGNTLGGIGVATLSGVNSYGGITTITNGTLQFAKRDSLYAANMGSWTASNLVVNAGGVASFYVGGTNEFTAADIQHFNTLGSGVDGFKSGSGIGFNTTSGNFTYSNAIVNTNAGTNTLGVVKYGQNTLTLDATNTYTGQTVVTEGTLKFPTRASFYNSATAAPWDAAHLWVVGATVTLGPTAAFNVGGTGEFTAADIQTISALGTATGGFSGSNIAGALSSNIGLDTTNAAGGVFTYNNNIVNPNAGQNPLGLTKLGTGTLELGGTNTYTGSTIVDGGTLRLTGGSHTVDPVTAANAQVTVTSEIGNYRIGSVATSTTGELIVDGANITSDNGLMVGENGTGSATINSGTIILKNDNAGNGQFLGIGRNVGSNGTYVQNGGSVSVGPTGTSDWFVVGVNGTGNATLNNNGTIKSQVFAISQGATANGTFTMNGGSVTTSANVQMSGAGAPSALNISGGTLTTGTNLTVYNGLGTITQTGGAVNLGTWMTLGEGAAGEGIYNMSAGTLTTGNENLVLGYFGKGTLKQTGGTVTVFNNLNLGWQTGSTGTYEIGAGASLTVTSGVAQIGILGTGNYKQTGGTVTVQGAGRRFSVGEAAGGQGNFEMSGGSIAVPNDWFIFGRGGTAIGTLSGTGSISAGINVVFSEFSGANSTFDMSGGSIYADNWSYVGKGGNANVTMTGGNYTIGDNFAIGEEATSTSSTFTVSGVGTVVTVNGNDPWYTGNLKVGANGFGTFNVNGGTIDMICPETPTGTYPQGTNNSASFSVDNTPGTPLELAQDGNLIAGEVAGNGMIIQTAGLIKVAANIFLGGTAGGQGTFTMTGGETRVGVTSPTGGDVVIGGAGGGSAGTLNLEGGTLNVTNGSGEIGASLGMGDFNFTGGTLKVKVFNTSVFLGSLGNLEQYGLGVVPCLLDVTGNDTAIESASYDLGLGTATIGNGRTLSAVSVLNSAGAGVINVGTGPASAAGDYNANGVVDAADYALWRKSPGTYGGDPAGYNVWRAHFGATASSPASLNVGITGTVDVDTLNLDFGSVIAGGGATVQTALTGTGSFSQNLTLAGGSTTTIDINSATDFDKITVGGLLKYGGNLVMDLDPAYFLTIAPTQTFQVFTFGSFDNTTPFTVETGWLFNPLTGVVTYNGGAANGSSLDSSGAVPEPTAGLLAMLAALSLVGCRTTRRSR
jgi:autotransporter-associated beta strand protein